MMSKKYREISHSTMRKKIGFPNAPLDPPSLSVILDKIQWACLRPETCTKKYFDIIDEMIRESDRCLTASRVAVAELRKLRKKPRKTCQK